MAKNLGDILLEQGIIDRDALDRALELQGRRLGEILIEENLADPVAIAQALKVQAQLTTASAESKLNIQIKDLEAILKKLDDGLAQTPNAAAFSSIRAQIETLLLIPADALFSPMSKLVAQLSQTLARPARFEAVSAEILLDRSVVTELSNMAIHLIRNAMDHGLESADDRKKTGKPTEGCIRASLSIESGELKLSISDDGAGVDLDKVFARAFEKGLTTKARAALTREEILKFLFTPGFSTALKAGAISGRGVGLDVVEACATRMGGRVLLDSNVGKGALFTVCVPLTFAKFSVLPLRIGNVWITLSAASVLTVENAPDGTKSAAELFGFTPTPPKVRVSLKNGASWGFDEVGSVENAFVRGLMRAPNAFENVAGEARLSNGVSALLMDL